MPDTPEMVEAVARAISGAPFSTASSRRKARAAIEAVRAYAYPQIEIILTHGDAPAVTLSGDMPSKILRTLIGIATTDASALAAPEGPEAGGKESLRTASLAVPEEGEKL